LATRPGALAIGFRWATLTLGAAAVALLVPLVVVLLPLALMYRLVLELTGWPIRHHASQADARRRASTQHVLTGV
jgi:ABC-type glycerol-3-phosphate transport system permease component